MLKRPLFLVICGMICLAACGPDTILVRPGLDTPSLHIANGRKFLERGKYSDAYREFQRARELDPKNISAHVGLGLACGYNGEFDAGLNHLAAAESLAVSSEDRIVLNKAYDQFYQEMRRKGVSQ
jgi:Flp pilus assembly protein TadD